MKIASAATFDACEETKLYLPPHEPINLNKSSELPKIEPKIINSIEELNIFVEKI